MELMTGSEVTDAYGSQAGDVANMLGTVVSAEDPDRIMIESWANTVSGRILDIGSGTGRWSGHLAELGHTIAGFEPVEQLVEIARRAHPDVQFRLASIDDLVGSEERWSGILAWYSLIHLGPDKLPDVLTTLRRVLEDGGDRSDFVLLRSPARGIQPPGDDCLPLADGAHDPCARAGRFRGDGSALGPLSSSCRRYCTSGFRPMNPDDSGSSASTSDPNRTRLVATELRSNSRSGST